MKVQEETTLTEVPETSFQCQDQECAWNALDHPVGALTQLFASTPW